MLFMIVDHWCNFEWEKFRLPAMNALMYVTFVSHAQYSLDIAESRRLLSSAAHVERSNSFLHLIMSFFTQA